MAKMDRYYDRIPVGSSAWVAIRPVNGCRAWSMLVSDAIVQLKGTLPSSGKAWLDNAAAVNAGGGKVQLNAALHGFTVGGGDSIVIAGTTNYNGTFTTTAGTTANILEITATYTAETILATATATGLRYCQVPPGIADRESYAMYGREAEPDEIIFYARALSGTAYVNMAYQR